MTRCLHAALLILATLGVGPRLALGQGPTLDSLLAGARVRITAPPQARMTGTLLGLRGDSLWVLGAPTPDTLRVALGAVRRLDVSRGTHRRVLRGALAGYLGGVALGGLLGWIALDAKQPSSSNLKGMGVAVGGILGGSAGIITGVVLGSQPVEQWESVSLRD